VTRHSGLISIKISRELKSYYLRMILLTPIYMKDKSHGNIKKWILYLRRIIDNAWNIRLSPLCTALRVIQALAFSLFRRWPDHRLLNLWNSIDVYTQTLTAREWLVIHEMRYMGTMSVYLATGVRKLETARRPDECVGVCVLNLMESWV